MNKIIFILLTLISFNVSSQEILPDFKHDCTTDTLIKSKIVISTQQARLFNAWNLLYTEQYELTKKVFDVVVYQDSLNTSLKNEIIILKQMEVLKDNEIKFHKEVIVNKNAEIKDLNKQLKYSKFFKYLSFVATTVAVVLILK